jgi:hypothetical protein
MKFTDGKLVAYGPEEDLNKVITWFKFGVAETDIKRDISECWHESTGPFGRPYKECMVARGYKQID